jgi:hypothetical protein
MEGEPINKLRFYQHVTNNEADTPMNAHGFNNSFLCGKVGDMIDIE